MSALTAALQEAAAETVTKDDVATLVLAAKKKAGLTWVEIADKISMSPAWTHSAALGMNSMPKEKGLALAQVLGLPPEVADILAECPTKTWDQSVPTDPTIYRLYEIVAVYGPTIKELIHEEFGDGIMSAIDFDMYVSRVPNEKGDRVKVEMTGKFLKYNSW